MNTSAFPSILDRHFKMNEDYLLDHVVDLFEQEKKLEVLPNYYDLVQEKEITPKMRTKLVEWMIQLADEIKLGYKTKQNAIIIVDLILSKLKIHKKYLQLLGITAIFITVKSEESFIYTLSHACEHCANAYTKEDVSAMEMLILKTLKWKLQYPTPGEIARRLVQLTNQFLGVNLAKFYKKTDNFVDLAISEFDLSVFPPTSIAAAAVMCSFENSLVHIEKWRILMMENFHLDFEGKIDILYQSTIQKLLKFYPDYFSFPGNDEFNKLTGGSAPEDEYHQHVGGMTLDTQTQNNNTYSEMGMTPQQTYMEEMNTNGLESGSQFGSPMKDGMNHYNQYDGLMSMGMGLGGSTMMGIGGSTMVGLGGSNMMGLGGSNMMGLGGSTMMGEDQAHGGYRSHMEEETY